MATGRRAPRYHPARRHPVDPARYQRLRALLHGAASVAAPGRRVWLEAACGDDPALVGEVLALLDTDPVATSAVAPAGVQGVVPSLSIAPGTRLGRRTVRGEIGRGGMGVVYEADDPDLGPVAVKVVLPHLLALTSVRERFLREARLGLAVTHENVVRTLDLETVTHEGVELHCLVLELVKGRTLRRLLESLGTVPEALLRELGAQAARGLAALHRAGIVHRDVKPENLVLTDDRRLLVMDLGVAKVLGGAALVERGTLTTAGQFVGSLHYAAPEQCEGTEVGPAADLYALGAVLYELATGRPPFETEGTVALMRAHLSTTPVPAAERNPAVSDLLSDAIEVLLAKRPADRFPSAQALAEALVEGEGGAWWATHRRRVTERRPRRVEGTSEVPLVGRKAERARLAQAWAEAVGGGGGTVLLAGEPGIGKSRLADELAGTAAREGAVVLRSGFSPTGTTEGMREALLTRLGTEANAAALARLLEVTAPSAEAFVAYLRRGASPADVEPLTAQRAEALLARLARTLPEQAPLLWIVEDVHFGDAESLRILANLARALEGRRALLLVTGRPGIDPELSAALGALPSFHRLDVGRLGEPDVVELLAASLLDRGVAASVARAIAPRADGIPFFVLELLREVERRGHLVRDPSGTWREARSLSTVEMPGALRDLLRARLVGLDPEERATLDVASVAGYAFEPELVARVRGVPRIAILEVLGRVERRHGIVRTDGRRLRFDHHLLREVLYDDLLPALRAEIHAQLADALEASPVPASAGGAGGVDADRAAAIADHRLRGPEPRAALPLVVPAALHLERSHRLARACDLLDAALSVEPRLQDADRLPLLLELARISRTFLRGPQGVAAAEEAMGLAERLGTPAVLARTLAHVTVHRLNGGRHEAALAAANRRLEVARAAGLPVDVAEARVHRGQALWTLGRYAEARAELEGVVAEAAAEAQDGPARQLEPQALRLLGVIAHETGYLAEAEAYIRRALASAHASGDVRGEATLTTNLGNVMTDLGRKEAALAAYAQALEACRRVGGREGEAIAWVNIGLVRTHLGDLTGAEEALRASQALCVELGLRRVEGYVLHGFGLLAAWRGDVVEARRRFEESVRLRLSLGNRHAAADALVALGSLEVREGRDVDAYAHLAQAVALAEQVGDPNLVVFALLWRAQMPGEDLEGPGARSRRSVRGCATTGSSRRSGSSGGGAATPRTSRRRARS